MTALLTPIVAVLTLRVLAAIRASAIVPHAVCVGVVVTSAELLVRSYDAKRVEGRVVR